MDVKEPSQHGSHRSHSMSSQSKSQSNVPTIGTIANAVTTAPESETIKKTVWPLLFASLVSELANIFTFYVVWHFAGQAAINQLSVAYPVVYFFSQAIPKAIGQASAGYIHKCIADQRIKQADEGVLYYFTLQGIYFVFAWFVAFFISMTFKAQAGIAADERNLAIVYVPLKMVVGTFCQIFNGGTEALLLLDNKGTMNALRSLSTSALRLMFVMLGYQYCKIKAMDLTLTQLAGAQVAAQLIPTAVMALYYLDVKAFSFGGVLKLKFKYFKSFTMQPMLEIVKLAAPKIFQFGSQAFLCWVCNLEVTIVFKEVSDIGVARTGLLLYYLGWNLFGFATLAYQSASEQMLSFNLHLKKFMRSKEFILTSFLWAMAAQGVLFIVALVWGAKILQFFVPTSRAAERSFFLMYSQNYLKYAGILPVVMLPLQYTNAVLQVERDLKLSWFLNLIHPVLGVITLFAVQGSVGDRAEMLWPQFYADLFAGIAGFLLLVRKMFEVMQMAKVELRRLKKKKKQEEDEARAQALATSV